MSEARNLVSKISRGTGLLIFGKARSGRHRAGTYAARQDEEIASPYQTRVSFVRQLVPGWNRLGQRRQGLDTDRRFRLKNTTQEMCRDVGLEGAVTLGVWAITQKAVRADHLACPRDNRQEHAVDDQLRHTAVNICRVGAGLNSTYLSDPLRRQPVPPGVAGSHAGSINVWNSSVVSVAGVFPDSCSIGFQAQSLQHGLGPAEGADNSSDGDRSEP